MNVTVWKCIVDTLFRLKALRVCTSFVSSMQDVVADLEQVKDDSIGIRAWLSGDKMIKFRTNLLLIGPDNVGAVLTGQEVYRLFQDAATNIIGAMDKVESYEISKKQAELSQQQYLDINSGKNRSIVCSFVIAGESRMRTDA